MKTSLIPSLVSPLHGSLFSLPQDGIIPSQLPGLKLWCRYGSGITVTGSGVSQWDDVSGNGNHLKQGTDLDRPQKQADGSILCDGIRQFLETDVFTFVQPETIYLLINLVTEVNGTFIADGKTANTGGIRELTTGTSIALLSPTQAIGATSTPIYGAYSVIAAVFNGAASFVSINNEAGDVLSPGTNGMGGFTLGAQGGGAGFGHVQAKEIIGYSEAHDAAQRAHIISYLQSI